MSGKKTSTVCQRLASVVRSWCAIPGTPPAPAEPGSPVHAIRMAYKFDGIGGVPPIDRSTHITLPRHAGGVMPCRAWRKEKASVAPPARNYCSIG